MTSHTVAAQEFAHRYEVSSRQHSGSCGEDAIIRIEDKKLLLRVILTKKENVCDFLLSNLFSEEDRCIFRKNCASVPEERSAIPLQTEQSSAG